MPSTDTWTTVRVAMRASRAGEAGLREDATKLETLAALLAERDDVGGVETRDPFTFVEGPDFVVVDKPELIAYTTHTSGPAVRGGVESLSTALGLAVTIEVVDHSGDAWRDVWKRHYRTLRFRPAADPSEAGLQIRPSWIPREPGDPTLEVVLDPGRAFGTGLHESTRLCLQALVELAHRGERPRPETVVDLGCGSGILGLACARLFPDARLLLSDHDPEAVETTRENAEVNALLERVELSVADLLAEPWAMPKLDRPALIIANIRPSVLIPAADHIGGALPLGGTLLLSGILIEEADSVRAAYPKLRELPAREEGDWTALCFVRDPRP